MVGSEAAAAACAAPSAALHAGRPSFLRPLVCLPWEIVPFTLGMFVLVEGLGVNGWLDSLAQLLGSWCANVTLALVTWGVVSILLANAINNQPMTILATRVTLSPRFAAAAGGAAARQASSCAIVVGSNVAANFTLIGALAGIMWSNILAQHGERVGYLRFVRLLAPLGVTAAVAALVMLGVEYAAWAPV
jgi:arsenical pump membrane protein